MKQRWVIVIGVVAACGGKQPSLSSVVDSGNTGSGSDDDASGNVPPAVAAGPYFQKPMFWNRDVSGVAKSSNSAAQIASLKSAGGFGNTRLEIDFTIEVLTADANAPKRTFTKNSSFYSPDCDNVAVPVPPNGNLEGETGYACTTGGDCHLIVHDPAAGTLYEMWKASITGTNTFSGGCLAAWDTTKAYDAALRGDQCTRADAAGYPIAPLLFTADEVAAGTIDHAIRFILPNDRIRRGYVRPATHGTDTTGGSNAPPYGVQLRLRADYPVDSLPSAGAKVVARAMQKYGMYHADGGIIALTAQSDRRTTAKWNGLLAARDLQAIKIEDFEVIDNGGMITLTYDCSRD